MSISSFFFFFWFDPPIFLPLTSMRPFLPTVFVRYVRRFTRPGIVKAVLVGMNPGPWGMAQTGVPFGETGAVREFLGMPPATVIQKPENEHPSRPVDGLSCKRSEVSGRRLWREWAESHFDSADSFFETFYVHNYCPLMWLEKSGRNRTPVQLPASERAQVHDFCDDALRIVIRALRPQVVVGIGNYARDRCKFALEGDVVNGLTVDYVLHPSPASPAANRGWVTAIASKLEKLVSSSSKSSQCE